jgi:hypothetical protein
VGGAVDGARGADGEPVDAADEGQSVIGFDDQMDVIGLDGEVDDAKRLAAGAGEGALQSGVDAVRAQRGDAVARAEGRVDGVAVIVGRATGVGWAGARAVRFATGAAATASPGVWCRECELFGWAATHSMFSVCGGGSCAFWKEEWREVAMLAASGAVEGAESAVAT